jgi:hypothetical protein
MYKCTRQILIQGLQLVIGRVGSSGNASDSYSIAPFSNLGRHTDYSAGFRGFHANQTTVKLEA